MFQLNSLVPRRHSRLQFLITHSMLYWRQKAWEIESHAWRQVDRGSLRVSVKLWDFEQWMLPHSQGHVYLALERGYSECPTNELWENEWQLLYNFSLIWTSCSYRSLFWSSKHKFLATVQEACLTPCLVTITGIMQRAVLSLKCRSFGCLCWKLEVSEPHCTICGRALLITELRLCLDSLRMSGWGSH